jgi:glycosyltransferase involved in cell wall biosynthesis
MQANLKVAYILHRFPVLSETFVMRELYWIRSQGIEIAIFSLLPGDTRIVHDQATELLALTQFSPYLSWSVVRANWHFLRRSPMRYGRAFAHAISQCIREPLVLARVLLLFPKSVYFARQLQQQGIEHIHTHFVWLGAIAAGVAADLLGLPFTVCSHAFDLFARNGQDVRRGLLAAARVVTISEHNRAFISQLCPEIGHAAIEVIHCGVDTDRYRPRDTPSAADRLQILAIGRLVETKGLVYLVDACKILKDGGLNIDCQIVGDGPLRAALQARIDALNLQDRVTLRGALNQTELLQIIRSSDIFALPAIVASSGDQDGIPVSLMEAMACGLPVVTTQLSGIPELVVDGETGVLVQQRNAADLADALTRLALDATLRMRIGNQARQKVLAEFELRHNVARLAAIFRQVTQRHAARAHPELHVQDPAPAPVLPQD